MNKKELISNIATATREMKELREAGKVEEAFAIVNKIERLEKELAVVEAEEKFAIDNAKKVEPQVKTKRKDIYDMIQKREPLVNGMSGAGDEGVLLPEEDVVTVRDLRRAFGSLEHLATITKTQVRKGSFLIEDLSSEAGLVEVDELTSITEVDGLKFTQVAWNVKDYAGLIKISRTFLNDAKENLRARITNSLARRGAITLRGKILEALKTAELAPGATVDAIKSIINVQLDTELLQGAVIVVGAETFDYLDGLKDNEGHYLLQPVATDATKKQLFGLPVEKVGKGLIDLGTAYVGNTQEFLHIYELQSIEIADSEHAFFAENAVAFRALQRFDVVKADKGAVFKVQLETGATAE